MYLVIHYKDYNLEDEKVLTRLGIDIETGINGMIVNVPDVHTSWEKYDFVFEILHRLGIKNWDSIND